MTYLSFIRHSLFASALLLMGALAIHAQTTVSTADVPRTISYQGLLTDNDGTPFADGQHDVTVTLYGDEGGTQPIWQQTYTTAVTAGVFNLYLGSGPQPLPESREMNTPLWIGTSVNGGPEMRPLTPLSASPYALNVPDKAITAEKVDMDYISELRIDGQKISAKGTVLNLVSTPAVPLSYDEATQSLTIGRAATQSGDNEKEAGILANQYDVWSMNGDGYAAGPGGGGGTVTPALGDWLGTSTSVDLILKVNSQQVMQYQQTGPSIPNIIGGQGNTITAATVLGSIIAEGTGNTITNGNYNVIGGGETNDINNAVNSVIAGGYSNTVTSDRSFIGGGHGNSTDGYLSVIGGGISNLITATPIGNVIGAGSSNRILGTSAAAIIGAGSLNTIDDASYAVLGGGWFNSIEDGTQNSISGGSNNHIMNSDYSAIDAGFWNVIELNDYSTIGGGEENRITTSGTTHATIGGGRTNRVQGSYGTIPGGDQLLTNASYAQTAVGFFNAPRGSMAVRPSAATIAASNDPLFMVGNGSVTGGTRSNAFEVSYNGHSAVYGVNGTLPPSITGGTFVDNVIYAWADVPRTTIGGPVTPLSDFGVLNINRVVAGVYDVTITVTNPAGAGVTLLNASVTATIVEDNALSPIGCGMIVTSHIGAAGLGANTFRVWTYNLAGGSCTPDDRAFTFKVTGRP